MSRRQVPIKLSDLPEKKRQMRSYDMAEIAAGGNGHAIADRNAVISRESAQKAKIIFA